MSLTPPSSSLGNSRPIAKGTIDALLQVVEDFPDQGVSNDPDPLVQGLRKRRLHHLHSTSPTSRESEQEEDGEEEEEDDEEEFEVDAHDSVTRGSRDRNEMPFKKRKLPLTNEKRLVFSTTLFL